MLSTTGGHNAPLTDRDHHRPDGDDPWELVMPFLFVGERRSRKAITMDVTWEDHRLAAHTLWNALEKNGINPTEQEFVNLYLDGEGPFKLNPVGCTRIGAAVSRGETIVAMGNRVKKDLERLKVPHLKIVHPAARGAIRLTERYVQHVGQRLVERL